MNNKLFRFRTSAGEDSVVYDSIVGFRRIPFSGRIAIVMDDESVWVTAESLDELERRYAGTPAAPVPQPKWRLKVDRSYPDFGTIYFHTKDDELVSHLEEFGNITRQRGHYGLSVSGIYSFDDVLEYVRSFEEAV